MAIAAIGVFFTQVAPNLVGDSMRIWLLSRLGTPWRRGLVSVLIDRGVGVGVIFALTFCVLLFPSGLTALGGHRVAVLTFIGALLVTALSTLVLAPYWTPFLERWPFSRWFASFALASRHVLLRRASGGRIVAIAVLIHLLSVAAIWSLGQAQGFGLSVIDAAALFAVMGGIALIPITVGGWGMRELAVTALLQPHGVPLERALFFSVSFGLVVLLASSVGAIVWAIYSPGRAASPALMRAIRRRNAEDVDIPVLGRYDRLKDRVGLHHGLITVAGDRKKLIAMLLKSADHLGRARAAVAQCPRHRFR